MTSDVLQLQSGAKECLERTRNYLLSKTIKTEDGWGLQQFLDEIKPGSTYIGVYGTSCGITTLLKCGENHSSPIIQNFKSWLIQRQEKKGGWTISTFWGRDILTTSTCYVINALNDAGENYDSPYIQDGLSWLQKTRNPDLGWGNYQNDAISKTTPTAHAIMTFSRFPEMLRTRGASESINWLLQSRNDDYGWGQIPSQNTPSTVGHTSLAVLALLSAGYPTHSSSIKEPVSWIMNNLEPASLATETELFYVQQSDQAVTTTFYHLPTMSLALRVLLLADVDPLGNDILSLANSIVSSQNQEGYWSESATQDKIPIWATMYSILALKEFISRIERMRETLDIRQTIVDQSKSIDQTYQKIADLQKQVAELERKINPISKILTFIRRFRVFIVLFISLCIYLVFLAKVDVPNLVEIAGAVFGALLTILGIWDARKGSKDG